MIYTGTDLVCPSGKPGSDPIVISLKAIVIAEGRQLEIAAVTPQKAAELLQVFNSAWTDLHKLKSQLVYEKTLAEKEANKRKSVVLLEIVPKVLKEKDLSSSTDIRKAILDSDEQLEDLQDKVDQIACVVEYITGKLKSFENSFTAVKKIMHEDVYNMLTHGGGGFNATSAEGEVGQVDKRGFGKPKY